MGTIIANRKVAGWLSPSRLAQCSVWLVSGLVSLLALFLAATSTAATANAPSTVLDNLALYASRGQPIHYCPTGWQQRHPATGTSACMVISDFTPFENKVVLLRDGEVLWVEFTSETLDMAELVQMWGRPQIEYDRAHRTSFRWTIPAAGLGAWMFWGDPREIPATTSLVLEALANTSILSPE